MTTIVNFKLKLRSDLGAGYDCDQPKKNMSGKYVPLSEYKKLEAEIERLQVALEEAQDEGDELDNDEIEDEAPLTKWEQEFLREIDKKSELDALRRWNEASTLTIVTGAPFWPGGTR